MLSAELYTSIEQVPREDWNALAQPHSEAMSWEFWRIVERAGLNDFRYFHVLLRDPTGRVMALGSFYSVTTDIAIFAPAPLRALLGLVRRLWPGFFKLRMLEWGTPITIVSPPYARVDEVEDAEVIQAMHRLMRQTARRQGQLLMLARDFEPPQESLRAPCARLGYHWIPSLPNTYLRVRWRSPEEYLGSMRSYYRSKVLKHLKRNLEAGVRHQRVRDFAHLADTLCAQWMVVHENASEFQREVLTPRFYRLLSEDMGGKAQVLLFHRGEQLVAHALLLLDGPMLRWLYVGRELAANDSLYLYVAYSVVCAAIELGAERLEMGLTTYAIKQDLGAEVTPIRIALRASWGLINPFVGLGYGLLNSVPAPGPREVFKAAVEAPARRGAGKAARGRPGKTPGRAPGPPHDPPRA